MGNMEHSWEKVSPGGTALASTHVHILLVEDDAGTLLVMGKLLTRLGYHVRCADSVASALEMVDQGPVDIVLSDVGLPDGTGYELMNQLRKRCDAIGIAMTGYGELDDLDRSRQAGFATHLVKPIDFEALKTVIAHLLSR